MEILDCLKNREEVFYINKELKLFDSLNHPFSMNDLNEVRDRLVRFRPLIQRLFPEVKDGIIESDLQRLVHLEKAYHMKGEVYIKRDDSLPIAGSVKARGGIYEVLYHTEQLALENGILDSIHDDYSKIADHKDFFHHYKMQVGSTGNLGLSIGIMSAVIGYQAIVHMSNDAVKWKKDKLRSYGVIVKEYEGNYSEAIKQGRSESDADPTSYFVDDENSKHLFLGYAVSVFHLQEQLPQTTLPIYVYLPCGVGGAPGGIAYGLKMIYKDQIHGYFIEPVDACCMTLGLASHQYNQIAVSDIGLSGKTYADGLAVQRCSGLVAKLIEPYIDGCITLKDDKLFNYLRDLKKYENIFIEPSSCASLEGLVRNNREGIHILWATGGSSVPEEIRKQYYNTYLK